MDNHYHLLFRTNRANLCRSMQWFGATYTKRFNLRHGIFVGTEKFVKKIKKRYLPDIPHAELPSQKRLEKDVDIDKVLTKAAGVLKCDINRFRGSARISQTDKNNQDLLIYISWQLGVATNQQIGERFGLTYSAGSRRAKVAKEKLNKDREFYRKYQHIKSLIKI